MQLKPQIEHWLNRRVEVTVHGEEIILNGFVVRADKAAPFITIIKLDSGAYITGIECTYWIK